MLTSITSEHSPTDEQWLFLAKTEEEWFYLAG